MHSAGWRALAVKVDVVELGREQAHFAQAADCRERRRAGLLPSGLVFGRSRERCSRGQQERSRADRKVAWPRGAHHDRPHGRQPRSMPVVQAGIGDSAVDDTVMHGGQTNSWDRSSSVDRRTDAGKRIGA